MSKEFEKSKLGYQKTLEKSLVGTLTLIIVLLQIFPKYIEHPPRELPPVQFQFKIEDIPITTQSVRYGQLPPLKPVVPVASEDPDVPLDATIDETLIDWRAGDSIFGRAGLTAGHADTVAARPVLQVLPEYPRELQKQNISGMVRVMLYVNENGRVQDAVVTENTTGSEVCSEAALAAAKKTTYIPAAIDGKKIATWVACVYTFKPD